MSHTPRLRGDVKARVGTAAVFEWVSPGPLALAPPTVTPPALVALPVSLVVAMPTGPITLALACPDSIAGVTGISDDRYRLTTAASPFAGAPGWIGRNGAAWLVTPQQAIEIHVADTGGTAGGLVLSDPLPREILVTGGYVVLSRREVVLPSATITAALRRDIGWRVDYHIKHGIGTALNAVPRSDSGLLHVVAQPFDPGCTSGDLIRYLHGIGGAASSGQQGWEGALQAGLAELELMVRLELSPRGLTEDDFPAPQRLRDVLLDLAGSHILRLTQREDADRLRELAMERFDRVMRATPWVDADSDGAVDAGEVTPAAQDWGRDFRWSAPSTTTRRFSIGGSH
jgi:hypothetical protein